MLIVLHNAQTVFEFQGVVMDYKFIAVLHVCVCVFLLLFTQLNPFHLIFEDERSSKK